MRRNIAEVRRNFSAAARYGLSLNLTVRENMEPRSPGVEALIKSEEWALPLRCSAPGRFSKGGRGK
jgi:hypothetical protein